MKRIVLSLLLGLGLIAPALGQVNVVPQVGQINMEWQESN